MPPHLCQCSSPVPTGRPCCSRCHAPWTHPQRVHRHRLAGSLHRQPRPASQTRQALVAHRHTSDMRCRHRPRPARRECRTPQGTHCPAHQRRVFSLCAAPGPAHGNASSGRPQPTPAWRAPATAALAASPRRPPRRSTAHTWPHQARASWCQPAAAFPAGLAAARTAAARRPPAHAVGRSASSPASTPAACSGRAARQRPTAPDSAPTAAQRAAAHRVGLRLLAQAQHLEREAERGARSEQLAEQQQRVEPPPLAPAPHVEGHSAIWKHERCSTSGLRAARAWKTRMPPQKMAMDDTTTSKSRDSSGWMRRSWYRLRPQATKPIPSTSAGLKSTFTMANVCAAPTRPSGLGLPRSSARAHWQRRHATPCEGCTNWPCRRRSAAPLHLGP